MTTKQPIMFTEHKTKKEAYATASKLRKNGIQAYLMDRENAARFIGIKATLPWVVYN